MAIVIGDVLDWWNFQDGSGTTVLSQKSGGTNIALTGTPTWVTGGPANLPNGVDFDGSSQYGLAATDYNFTEGAFGVWFSADTLSGTDTICGNGNLGGAGEGDIFCSGTTLTGRSRVTTPSADKDVTSTISTATLYFVVFNMKPAAFELFVNGSSVSTNTTAGTPLTGGSQQFVVARRSPISATAYLDGKIFQTMIFNRILTSTEVSDLYNAGAGKTYAQLFSAPTASNQYFTMMGVG